ncbi:hypothetical protein BJY00DRAFT_296805 [Aspergillus carlsbadensis]|nr:hypothetical protein BJY00DRAFT_296805 [Aspergillus carlsbadensis]
MAYALCTLWLVGDLGPGSWKVGRPTPYRTGDTAWVLQLLPDVVKLVHALHDKVRRFLVWCLLSVGRGQAGAYRAAACWVGEEPDSWAVIDT